MPCPKPPRTYCKDGVFFIRLFVPQRLAAFVARPKIVQSLKTRDRHLAYVRALNINLAFELWVEKLTRPLSEEELAKLIVQRIAEQRERSTAAADAPSLALEQLNELLAAIGNLQTSVDAATADVANAKTPEARKQAEQRLARLRIQMMRLNQQLQMARQRQLNEGGRTKLKL